MASICCCCILIGVAFCIKNRKKMCKKKNLDDDDPAGQSGMVSIKAKPGSEKEPGMAGIYNNNNQVNPSMNNQNDPNITLSDLYQGRQNSVMGINNPQPTGFS